MIKERYCSYEVAMLLKEKGFDIGCYGRYSTRSKEFHFDATRKCENHGLFVIAAPTHQMACDWMIEAHHICITIYPNKEKGFEAVLYDIKSDVEITLQSFGVFGYHIFESSYGKAVEVALKYILENLVQL